MIDFKTTIKNYKDLTDSALAFNNNFIETGCKNLDSITNKNYTTYSGMMLKTTEEITKNAKQVFAKTFETFLGSGK